ncbi:hypothetical protein L210DRAFT_3440381 [Boletus edulis BED1]|uniref:Uncharacterized protein n=1 Tax=Boletus edulis BED1 TaxID=1328754 RepID=A0AAD4GKK5_BOLED|nr:hypothetical protein L210DRAFT_3440381 [Boletus edulis BED1]
MSHRVLLSSFGYLDANDQQQCHVDGRAAKGWKVQFLLVLLGFFVFFLFINPTKKRNVLMFAFKSECIAHGLHVLPLDSIRFCIDTAFQMNDLSSREGKDSVGVSE